MEVYIMRMWMILFSQENDPSMALIAEQLPSIGFVRDVKLEGTKITIHAEDAEFRVYYENEFYVIGESSEIGEEFAKDRQDRDYIAQCEKRFVIYWDVEDDGEFVTSLIRVTDILSEHVKGKLFDPTEGIFM
jgi:hypothetical protein